MLNSSCDFCPPASDDGIHKIETDTVGVQRLHVMENTRLDTIRVGVADVVVMLLPKRSGNSKDRRALKLLVAFLMNCWFCLLNPHSWTLALS